MSQAMFGTEQFEMYTSGDKYWKRDDDGFFETQSGQGVAGYVSLSPMTSGTFCDYSKTLFINDRHENTINEIIKLFDVQRTYNRHQLP